MVRHGERLAVRKPRGSNSGSSRPPISRDEMISKKLSWVLRHGAIEKGLKMDENGYVNCAELLSWQPLRSLQVTFSELRTIVATNDKQRFHLIPDPTLVPSTSSSSDPHSPVPVAPDLPYAYLIRASQGHSLPIASSAFLTPILPTDEDFPEEVVHGTYSGAWLKILASGGLSRMERTHIHFAAGVPEAILPSISAASSPSLSQSEASTSKASIPTEQKIISSMRRDASLLVWVSVRRSAASGLKWWRSANGVVLSEGDERGFVATEWIERVVRRSDGVVIWKQDS